MKEIDHSGYFRLYSLSDGQESERRSKGCVFEHERPINVFEFEALARERLPKEEYDYIDATVVVKAPPL